jgi:hypothetical protein
MPSGPVKSLDGIAGKIGPSGGGGGYTNGGTGGWGTNNPYNNGFTKDMWKGFAPNIY